MDESINSDLEKAINILERNPKITACATIAVEVNEPFVYQDMRVDGDFQNSVVMLCGFINAFAEQFNLPPQKVCQELVQHFEQKG